ncbi:anaphase-promoting complex subunit 10-like [Xenia sp. Carnegie-2017]|uniref:anaphase-promoting complex subunit 10-like n=1 Tax=Xenia sp. Carnegie-2017 TaxID=2897299 RepID=UPI001F04486F|nr:anaphase-promoting complex subunit 10-like [Xenia sp. Carnegie-2017]
MASDGDLADAEQSEPKFVLQPTLNDKLREIGHQAVWSLSSCKPGYGVEQLRDGNLDTYWQSDGPQPHLVNIKFRRKTLVQNVCIFVDYKSDESYTPSKLCIRAGNCLDSLRQVDVIELLDEPSGWLVVPVGGKTKLPLKTFMIQIAVLTNHQNGRDTHLRQIKLHAPPNEMVSQKMPNYTTVEFSMYSTIR